MRGIPIYPESEQQMTKTLTRHYSLTLATDVTAASLDDPILHAIRDEAFARLQGAMFSLVDQGIFSGAFTFHDQSPPISLSWSISVTETN